MKKSRRSFIKKVGTGSIGLALGGIAFEAPRLGLSRATRPRALSPAPGPGHCPQHQDRHFPGLQSTAEQKQCRLLPLLQN